MVVPHTIPHLITIRTIPASARHRRTWFSVSVSSFCSSVGGEGGGEE